MWWIDPEIFKLTSHHYTETNDPISHVPFYYWMEKKPKKTMLNILFQMIGKGSICQWFKTIISLSPIGLTVILNTGSFLSHQLSNIYGTFELWFPWKTFTNVWLKFRLQADTLYVFNEFMGIENYFMIKQQQPIYDGQIFYSDFII